MKFLYKKTFQIAFSWACLCQLSGCQKARDIMGLSRHQPDAFETPLRQPLTLPTMQELPSPNHIVKTDYDENKFFAQAQHLLNMQSHQPQVTKPLENAVINRARQNQQPDQAIRHSLKPPVNSVHQDPALIKKILFWQSRAKKKEKVLNPRQEYTLKPNHD